MRPQPDLGQQCIAPDGLSSYPARPKIQQPIVLHTISLSMQPTALQLPAVCKDGKSPWRVYGMGTISLSKRHINVYARQQTVKS